MDISTPDANLDEFLPHAILFIETIERLIKE